MGGVHPQENKLSRAATIEALALPDVVNIPLAQHIGAPAVAKVAKGDKVLTGQLIAEAGSFMSANIHSPISGTVTAVDMVANGQGLRQMMITIKREGDEWVETVDRSTELRKQCDLSSQEIIAKIKEAGIVGMGGATFPAHVKLSVPPGKKAEFLIINGVECEPYLTSDHRTMLERGEELLVGVTILMKAIGVTEAYIGIENNKPDAIAHLGELAKSYPGVHVTPLKVQYPQGGEKQLIAAVTGRQVPPPPGLPIDVGAVVCNASTTVAVYEAVQKDKPLIERVVTLTGKSVKNPKNLLTRMGTPIRSLIEAAGGLPEDTGKVVNGGPMMGRAMVNLDSPVTNPEREGGRARRRFELHQVRQVRVGLPDGSGAFPALETLPQEGLGDGRDQPYHRLHRVRQLSVHLPGLPAAAGLDPSGQADCDGHHPCPRGRQRPQEVAGT